MRRILKWGCGGLLVLVVVGAILASLGGDADTDEEAQVAAPATAQIAAPTETSAPDPTETQAEETEPPQPSPPPDQPPPTPPVPPSPLPEPTATAEPTQPPPTQPQPTVTPGLTAEEQAYLDEVLNLSDSYANSFTEIGELMIEGGADSSLIFDEDWRLSVAVNLGIWRANAELIRELDPPARFSDAHEDLLAAAEDFEEASSLLAEGIDEFSADKLNQAAELMSSGNLNINAAAEKITEAGE